MKLNAAKSSGCHICLRAANKTHLVKQSNFNFAVLEQNSFFTFSGQKTQDYGYALKTQERLFNDLIHEVLLAKCSLLICSKLELAN